MSIRSDDVYSRSYRGKVKGLVLDWSGRTPGHAEIARRLSHGERP